MAASGAAVYRQAYIQAISGPAKVEPLDGVDYCGMGLTVKEIRAIFESRGWNPSYSHQSWQRALATWEEFHNIRRIGKSVFFIPRDCDRTMCAVKIERIMTPQAVAVI